MGIIFGKKKQVSRVTAQDKAVLVCNLEIITLFIKKRLFIVLIFDL